MKINQQKLKKLLKNRGLSLTDVLREAGVSKTAYYHLARKDSLLPASLESLADVLQLSPTDLLESEPAPVRKVRRREAQLSQILKSHPEAERDNVWHTLILLEQPPIERLNGALRRANN